MAVSYETLYHSLAGRVGWLLCSEDVLMLLWIRFRRPVHAARHGAGDRPLRDG